MLIYPYQTTFFCCVEVMKTFPPLKYLVAIGIFSSSTINDGYLNPLAPIFTMSVNLYFDFIFLLPHVSLLQDYVGPLFLAEHCI